MKLDPIDRRILNNLQTEGRLTNQALSEQVGLSTTPCWRKVRQLEESGVIEGYSARLNRRAVGLGVLAFIRVKIDSHDREESEQFAEQVQTLKMVIACYSLAGDADFLLQVVAKDLDDYADFAMNEIRRLPRIKEMQTTMVLKEIKPFSGYPLEA
ncbi:DNA-binding transcriptional regulator, Lrp family [Cohaesibacter sp. ES.047]|uniref:Lrp/AsnC family transcriptional regulator n=1 Tax=Cohaesibacter sp. ES.047 TaxID=1798205 RepID=UPI000BB8CDE6|nr:Lrp/AsnC family transcriptional regulator [Cohaesibacter sp. ES.047]SNY93878.1 DNA-binding transcriptional regulator, Lrp family [Cohaesibacter sp. ES.047]